MRIWLLLWLCWGLSWANAAQKATTPEAELRLISAQIGLGNSEKIWLGLEFKLKDDWKVYWRSPGDAGTPPKIEWQGSENLAQAEIFWPRPTRFEFQGLNTIGYHGQVILPIALSVIKPGEPLNIKAQVEFLICGTLCIPREVSLDLLIPPGLAEPGPDAKLLGEFISQLPEKNIPGLAISKAVWLQNPARLQVETTSESKFVTEVDLLPEALDVSFDLPQISFKDGLKKAVFTFPILFEPEGGIQGKKLTLTLMNGEQLLEGEIIPDQQQSSDQGTWPLMLAIALLGGFILNLMPCVLPVLSLKFLGLANHPEEAKTLSRRWHFVATALGIIFSFLILAGMALGLKAAGMAAGWGVQFQEPRFLVGMSIIITLCAANLWGFYEITLPYWLLGNWGDAKALSGHFATGMFATLLATPCSAPFLGTAVSFALARDYPEILSIFLALGLGMASPYLLIAFWPHLSKYLPKPGRWMLVLKKAMGFLLMATALWLLSVLYAQITPGNLLIVASGIIFLLLGLKFLPRGKGLLTLVMLVVLIITPAEESRKDSKANDKWQSFSLALVKEQVALGRVVLVDVTADWCVTCKVNKAVALEREAIKEMIDKGEIIALRADWTRPDPVITAYLQSFGRYGIPFNAVYGPAAVNGIALSELLTLDMVIEAIKKAK